MKAARDYQIDLVTRARERCRGGVRRLILQAETGAGKSFMAALLVKSCHERGHSALFVARGRELVHQFAGELIDMRIPHGILMRGEDEFPSARVQIASKDTLVSWCQRRRVRRFPPADLVIFDECFPAGTLIDGVPIEKIKAGDKVWSYNHANGTLEKKPVLRTMMRRKPSRLLRLTLSDGRQITCTPEHPFYLPGLDRYVIAESVRPNDFVLLARGHHAQTVNDSARHIAVLDLRHASAVRGGCGQTQAEGGQGLLLGRVPPQDATASGHVAPDQRAQRQGGVGRAHAPQEPHEQPGNKGQDGGHPQGDRTQADCAGRQWQRADAAGESTGRGAGLEPGDCADRQTEGSGLPDALQGRRGQPEFEDCGGDRRPLARQPGAEGTGPQEGGATQSAWVESVEVLEYPGGYQPFGLHPEGSVFNLEVEDNNNYFANGVLVHNCHESIGRTWINLMAAYPQAVFIGLTATPARGDGRGLGDVWSDLICAAPTSVLISKGHIVPTRVFAPTRPNLKGVKVEKGDYNVRQLSERMNTTSLVGNVVQHWQEFGENRLTIVYAVDCAHGLALQKQFQAAGIHAGYVDGETDTAERDSILEEFSRDGALRVLVNVAVLKQGVDIPAASCCILARPTRSLVFFRQAIGRIRRPYPGKEYALVIDHAGAVHVHGLPDEDVEWEGFLDTKKKIQERHQKKLDAEERRPITCAKCKSVYAGVRVCPVCGTEAKRQPREVKNKAGKLVEVTAEALSCPVFVEQMQREWNRAIAVMCYKGQTLSAAAHMFFGKYKRWPWEFRDRLDHVPPAGAAWKCKASEAMPQFMRRRQA